MYFGESKAQVLVGAYPPWPQFFLVIRPEGETEAAV